MSLPTPTGNRPAHTVLVADDDVESRALMKSALENEGFEVVVAEDGLRALDAYQRIHPDCAVLDVRMPGLDGLQVCTEIRKRPGGADVPIIFVTALRDLDTFEDSIRAGGNDFLTKPIRLSELSVRLALQLKLRTLGASLRDTLYELQSQREQQTRIQLQKERMAAFVIHDLKNPIHSIELQTQLLLRRGALSERDRTHVEAIRTDVQRLSRLVLNLLDTSKAEEGRLEPTLTNVDLPGLVSDVIERLRPAARAAQITLSYDVPALTLQLDPDLFTRVLENLVDNSLKHAGEGARILIRASEVVDHTELRVIDDGPGIPESARHRVFDKYVTDRAAASRGLGLAFCRLVVEAHRGRIWVEDAKPGTAVCIQLPHV